MLFANIEMFIAINKFYKLFLFMVFVLTFPENG